MADKLRCKDCGYITDKFHGWEFVSPKCRTPNAPTIHHNWEIVANTVGFSNKEGPQNE